MTSQALISKIHITLSANQERDSDFNAYMRSENASLIRLPVAFQSWLSKVRCPVHGY